MTTSKDVRQDKKKAISAHRKAQALKANLIKRKQQQEARNSKENNC